MLGWRKLSAWFLVYAFVFVATVWARMEIPPENAKLITYITGFFFGANTLKPLMQNLKVNLGPVKE